MRDYSKYLLRTPGQILDFRVKYARYIREQSDAFAGWINGFPAREWMDYLAGVPEGNIPVVIGTICILFIDGLIDINFNETATRIRRQRTEAEWEAYWTPLRKLGPRS